MLLTVEYVAQQQTLFEYPDIQWLEKHILGISYHSEKTDKLKHYTLDDMVIF